MTSARPPHTDLFGLAVLSLAVLGIAFVPSWHSPLRVLLGLTFVLAAPGYALTTALFPRRGDLAGAERLALCIGLSVATVPLLGLLLNYTPWGIRLLPVTVTLVLFVMLMAGASLYRRRLITPEERFQLFGGGRPQSYAALWALLAAGFALVSGVVAAQHLRPTETFSEFYLLGPEGRLENLPTTLEPGETFRLTLGVGNFEGERVAYRVRTPQETLALPPLGDGERWEEALTLSAPPGTGRAKLQFDLFREGARQPYRSLHLFVTVTPPSTPVLLDLPPLQPSAAPAEREP